MVSVMIHVIIVLSLCYLVSKKFWKGLLQTDHSLFLRSSILYEYKFGSTHGRNTTHAILSLVDCIINSIENNNISCGISLDISEASDTMDYSILLGKHSKYDIYVITLTWFKSY